MRRLLINTPVVFGVLMLVTTCSMFYYSISTGIPKGRLEQEQMDSNSGASLGLCTYNTTPSCSCDVSSRGEKKPWDSSNYLVGPRKRRYKANLRSDTFYITSWANAGFTNQFMSYANMIYLGTISDRVPIVPPFAPDHHISSSAGPLPFGEIFDMPRFRQTLRLPILEWNEVKAVAPRLSLEPPTVVEQLGCWSTRPPREKDPVRAVNVVNHLGLDVSYTRVPSRARHNRNHNDKGNPHISMYALAEILYPMNPGYDPGDREIMSPSPLGVHKGPDVHMACLDLMYYTSVGTEEFEWKQPWSPVWRTVGRHLHFSDHLVKLTKIFVRRALGVSTTELPAFIAVHIRRGDFVNQCWDVPTGCLAPLTAYARRIEEVQQGLLSKRGIDVTEVLITSDEKDPAFWEGVTARGWKYIDHSAEDIVDLHGEWYLPLIDIVSHSLGIGFVGTKESTVSIVSARRVKDWNEGVTSMVNWGEL